MGADSNEWVPEVPKVPVVPEVLVPGSRFQVQGSGSWFFGF